MILQLNWTGIGVIVAVFTHCVASVWWASKLTSRVDSINLSLSRIDKELEKRDIQISAAWKQIDHLKERVTRIESKYE